VTAIASSASAPRSSCEIGILFSPDSSRDTAKAYCFCRNAIVLDTVLSSEGLPAAVPRTGMEGGDVWTERTETKVPKDTLGSSNGSSSVRGGSNRGAQFLSDGTDPSSVGGRFCASGAESYWLRHRCSRDSRLFPPTCGSFPSSSFLLNLARLIDPPLQFGPDRREELLVTSKRPGGWAGTGFFRLGGGEETGICSLAKGRSDGGGRDLPIADK